MTSRLALLYIFNRSPSYLSNCCPKEIHVHLQYVGMSPISVTFISDQLVVTESSSTISLPSDSEVKSSSHVSLYDVCAVRAALWIGQ